MEVIGAAEGNGPQQVVLGLEVAVNAGCFDAHALGELAHAGGLEALLTEQLGCDGKNVLLPVGRFPLPRAYTHTCKPNDCSAELVPGRSHAVNFPGQETFPH